MPDYDFYTEETVHHIHVLTIDLPVDMGESNERLTDRMAKTVAKEGAIVGMTNDEKIVAVYRDNTKIWPRQHKKELTIGEVGHPISTKPDEEEEK